MVEVRYRSYANFDFEAFDATFAAMRLEILWIEVSDSFKECPQLLVARAL